MADCSIAAVGTVLFTRRVIHTSGRKVLHVAGARRLVKQQDLG
jgi:hypothetical protein